MTTNDQDQTRVVLARLRAGASTVWRYARVTVVALIAEARERIDRRKKFEPGPDDAPEEQTP
jgi:hypothetical protein